MIEAVERERDFYPSATICSGLKWEAKCYEYHFILYFFYYIYNITYYRQNSANILDLFEKTSMKTFHPENISRFLGAKLHKTYYHNRIQMIILDDNEWNFNLTDIILGVFQEYKEDYPWCDREKFSGRNLIEDPSLWTTSIPHPDSSGKCFTFKYIKK